jgi:tetraacyldisaccharide 4'-kinase
VVEAIALPDHFDFEHGQVERFVGRAESAGLVPVTTEKDAARLPASVTGALAGRLVVLPVQLHLDGYGLDGLLSRIG